MLLRSAFIVCLVICSVTVIGTFVVAQQTEKSPDYKFTVGVRINEDDDFDLRVASYLKRELRGLGDVKVVDGSAEWTLSVTGIEQETSIALAVVVTSNALNMIFKAIEERGWADRDFLDSMPDKEMRGFIFAELLLSQLHRGTHLLSYGKDRLGKACEDVVTRFDIEYLEQERKK